MAESLKQLIWNVWHSFCNFGQYLNWTAGVLNHQEFHRSIMGYTSPQSMLPFSVRSVSPKILGLTLPETNIAPENGWLEC